MIILLKKSIDSGLVAVASVDARSCKNCLFTISTPSREPISTFVKMSSDLSITRFSSKNTFSLFPGLLYIFGSISLKTCAELRSSIARGSTSSTGKSSPPLSKMYLSTKFLNFVARLVGLVEVEEGISDKKYFMLFKLNSSPIRTVGLSPCFDTTVYSPVLFIRTMILSSAVE